MQRTRILLIEDVLQFRILVEAALGERFEIVSVQTRKDALALLDQKYDLILLDVGLPDGDGYDICQKVRQSPVNGKVPVIFLTGREGRDDLVTAYRLGADDFLTKPFDPHVLRECVLSKLKRFSDDPEFIQYENVTLNTRSHRVTLDGSLDVKLTRTEFALLALFLTNVEVVLSRDTILEKVWGSDKNVTDRTIDVHLTNLRKKIPALGTGIEAIHGLGYRLRAPSSLPKTA